MKESIDSGAQIVDLYENHFGSMVRYGRGLRDYRKVKAPRRDWAMTVFLFVGLPGTGKTRTAVRLAEMLGSYYMVPPAKSSGLYFDLYDGEDTIIIDEMDGGRCQPTFFNMLCDRYPMEVPVHGGSGTQMVSKRIFLTSNFHPKYWWKTASVAAVMRRLDCIIKFIPLNDSPKTTVLYDSILGRWVSSSVLLNSH